MRTQTRTQTLTHHEGDDDDDDNDDADEDADDAADHVEDEDGDSLPTVKNANPIVRMLSGRPFGAKQHPGRHILPPTVQWET